MSFGWNNLPLLPLGKILELLSFEDALAAMSTSCHWRAGLLIYEGRRETLTLHAKEFDKSAFLARMFKRNIRVLQVDVSDCSYEELCNFMNRVMPHFFDTLKLEEVLFIGPGCVQQTAHANAKLDRVITETLMFKHSHCIQKFALINCEMDTKCSKNNDLEMHVTVDHYSRGLSFEEISPVDSVLSRHNAEIMTFSALQHIIVDYDLITTESLETLSHLTSFSQLSAIVCNKKLALHSVDWSRAMACYPNGLDIGVNLVSLPASKIDEVIEVVLVEDLCLTSLKVMFCKTLYAPLLKHLVRVHASSLRELVWADAPHEGPCTRVIRTVRTAQYDANNVNPIILLCWRCSQLRRLEVHGYWMWQYDVVGLVRLRTSLRRLEVSAVYGRQRRLPAPAVQHASLARVLAGDATDTLDAVFIRQVNEYTEFKWKPTPLRKLHPALRVRATPEQRTDYIVQELRGVLGVSTDECERNEGWQRERVQISQVEIEIVDLLQIISNLDRESHII